MSEPAFVLTAEYLVVTPMFLSGADQNVAELRLPSFKGALRFWWRALAEERDTQELRKTEDRLFGSTRTGVSRVRMRLVDVNIADGWQNKFPRNSWQSYTGFGLIDKPGQTQRHFIKPSSTFGVRLDGSRCDETTRKQLTDALIALGLVGGLGSRARNGWGSITLVSLEDEDGNSLWQAPADADELKDELTKCFNGNQRLADWSAFSDQSVFAVGPAQDTQEKAHEWLAEKYRDALKTLSQDKARREVFGLPRKNVGKNTKNRRAGAVFLHIHQIGGEEAVPVALCLPARFLENQEAPQGGWRAAQEFVKGVATR